MNDLQLLMSYLATVTNWQDIRGLLIDLEACCMRGPKWCLAPGKRFNE